MLDCNHFALFFGIPKPNGKKQTLVIMSCNFVRMPLFFTYFEVDFKAYLDEKTSHNGHKNYSRGKSRHLNYKDETIKSKKIEFQLSSWTIKILEIRMRKQQVSNCFIWSKLFDSIFCHLSTKQKLNNGTLKTFVAIWTNYFLVDSKLLNNTGCDIFDGFEWELPFRA